MGAYANGGKQKQTKNTTKQITTTCTYDRANNQQQKGQEGRINHGTCSLKHSNNVLEKCSNKVLQGNVGIWRAVHKMPYGKEIEKRVICMVQSATVFPAFSYCAPMAGCTKAGRRVFTVQGAEDEHKLLNSMLATRSSQIKASGIKTQTKLTPQVRNAKSGTRPAAETKDCPWEREQGARDARGNHPRERCAKQPTQRPKHARPNLRVLLQPLSCAHAPPEQ